MSKDKDIKARFAASMARIDRELKRLEELNRRAFAEACAEAAPQPAISSAHTLKASASTASTKATVSALATIQATAKAVPAIACERYKRVHGAENISVRLENGATIIFPIVDAGKLLGSSTVEWFDPASGEIVRTTTLWGADDGGAE